jgi:hypothetical protein
MSVSRRQARVEEVSRMFMQAATGNRCIWAFHTTPPVPVGVWPKNEHPQPAEESIRFFFPSSGADVSVHVYMLIWQNRETEFTNATICFTGTDRVICRAQFLQTLEYWEIDFEPFITPAVREMMRSFLGDEPTPYPTTTEEFKEEGEMYFPNVTLIYKGIEHVGVYIRSAKDGTGDYFCRSKVGRATCFITSAIYENAVAGHKVDITC